jgi:hypothetical protein
MNPEVKRIIQSYKDKKEKIEELNQLKEDIEIAMEALDGKWKYCEKCGVYYLAKSFLTDSKIENKKICVYDSPINSGDDEYRDGEVTTIYRICPRGHETILDKTKN